VAFSSGVFFFPDRTPNLPIVPWPSHFLRERKPNYPLIAQTAFLSCLVSAVVSPPVIPSWHHLKPPDPLSGGHWHCPVAVFPNAFFPFSPTLFIFFLLKDLPFVGYHKFLFLFLRVPELARNHRVFFFPLLPVHPEPSCVVFHPNTVFLFP